MASRHTKVEWRGGWRYGKFMDAIEVVLTLGYMCYRRRITGIKRDVLAMEVINTALYPDEPPVTSAAFKRLCLVISLMTMGPNPCPLIQQRYRQGLKLIKKASTPLKGKHWSQVKLCVLKGGIVGEMEPQALMQLLEQQFDVRPSPRLLLAFTPDNEVIIQDLIELTVAAKRLRQLRWRWSYRFTDVIYRALLWLHADAAQQIPSAAKLCFKLSHDLDVAGSPWNYLRPRATLAFPFRTPLPADAPLFVMGVRSQGRDREIINWFKRMGHRPMLFQKRLYERFPTTFSLTEKYPHPVSLSRLSMLTDAATQDSYALATMIDSLSPSVSPACVMDLLRSLSSLINHLDRLVLAVDTTLWDARIGE